MVESLSVKSMVYPIRIKTTFSFFLRRRHTMHPLRKRFIEDMQLQGMSERTQKIYVCAVRQLAEHYGKSPDKITEEELRDYFLYVKNVRKWSRSTSTIALCAFKFFFEKTIKRDWPTLSLVRPQPEKKLPVVLSTDEVGQILANVRLFRHRVCLTTIYSCGLRLQEATRLKVRDIDGDGEFNLKDIAKQLKANKHNEWTPLDGDGDFRSDECIELLKQADIVVTNPPFSLFREYVAQLMEYKKKFLILGDQNAVTYKETFGYVQNNKLWVGYDNGGTKWFQVPMDYDIPTESRKKIVNGVKYFSMGRILWFTNLNTTKRHDNIVLYKKYTPKEFPKYDNYDVINVDKVSDIPLNYNGVMGVPITFVDKYNPKQFEILGVANSARWIGYKCLTLIKGRKIYNRILIKRKK